PLILRARQPTAPLLPYTPLFRSHVTRPGFLDDGPLPGEELRGGREPDRLSGPHEVHLHPRLEVPRADTDERDAIPVLGIHVRLEDRKSTRLNSSHVKISYAVFCL